MTIKKYLILQINKKIIHNFSYLTYLNNIGGQSYNTSGNKFQNFFFWREEALNPITSKKKKKKKL